MAERTCVLTQSRHLSISEAKHACHAACDLTDVHIALGCLQTLLSREKNPGEDDADVCDGVAAIIRLINESLLRREDAASHALQAMFEVVDRKEGL
jgi:hypothetical protein